MKVEVLHIEGCASWKAAGERTRLALDAVGLADVPVEYVIIRTERDAARSGFAGSPTIVVDGQDLFPSRGRTHSLACRVYATEAGLAAAPTQSQLEQALRSAAEPGSSEGSPASAVAPSGGRSPSAHGSR